MPRAPTAPSGSPAPPVSAPAQPRRSTKVEVHRIEVALAQAQPDPAGRQAVAALREAGLASVSDVRVVRVYFLEGALGKADLERAAGQVLADAVLDRWTLAGHLPVEGSRLAV